MTNTFDEPEAPVETTEPAGTTEPVETTAAEEQLPRTGAEPVAAAGIASAVLVALGGVLITMRRREMNR